jgi:cell division protein FtsB
MNKVKAEIIAIKAQTAQLKQNRLDMIAELAAIEAEYKKKGLK